MHRRLEIPNIYIPIAIYQPLSVNLTEESIRLAGEFSRLIREDFRQERVLIVSACLTRSARHRVNSLVENDYFAHCDMNDVCANEVARSVGVPLPPEYSIDGNSIESLIAGVRDVEKAFDFLSRSPKHADHLFGRNDFTREQTFIGVAFRESPMTKYSFYYAIHISRLETPC